MPLEALYQIVPDGTGKKIRNVQQLALEQDGTIPTSPALIVQCVVAVDADTGVAVPLATKASVDELARLLRGVVRGLARLAEVEPDDLLDNEEETLNG